MSVPVTPATLLARLRPFRTILAVCHWGGRTGAAVSDPYLRSARPVADIDHADASGLQSNALGELLAQHNVGAVAVALPLAEAGAPSEMAGNLSAQRELLASLRPTGLLLSEISGRRSAADACEHASAEPELWEELDDFLRAADAHGPAAAASSAPASVHAACALNFWLWDYCEGWRNTFG